MSVFKISDEECFCSDCSPATAEQESTMSYPETVLRQNTPPHLFSYLLYFSTPPLCLLSFILRREIQLL